MVTVLGFSQRESQNLMVKLRYHLQNLYAPDPDPELEVVHYERTEEQNDALGITDMKTEGYEVD